MWLLLLLGTGAVMTLLSGCLSEEKDTGLADREGGGGVVRAERGGEAEAAAVACCRSCDDKDDDC